MQVPAHYCAPIVSALRTRFFLIALASCWAFTSIPVFAAIVTEYSIPGAPWHLGGPTATNLLKAPDGNVWFQTFLQTNLGAQIVVARVTPAGVVSEFPLLGRPDTGLSERDTGGKMVIGPDNNSLWFFYRSDGPPQKTRIARVTLSGVVSEFDLQHVPANLELLRGPDGKLWYGGVGFIAKLDPLTLSNSRTDLSRADLIAQGLVIGSDRKVWTFLSPTSLGAGAWRIARAETASSSIAEFPIPTSNLIFDRLVLAGDGNLWFLGGSAVGYPNADADKIRKVSTSGQITAIDLSTTPGQELVVGQDGNLWFSQRFPPTNLVRFVPASGAVTVFSGADASLTIGNITFGSDGNTWFSSGAAAGLGFGRMTSLGTYDYYFFPRSSGGSSDEMVNGGDGLIWFAAAGRIGKLSNPVEFSVESERLFASENAGVMSVTVARSGNSDGVATLTYSTNPGSASVGLDYSTTSGVLTFPAGVAAQTISIPLNDDLDVEAVEYLRLQLTSPSSAAALGGITAVVTGTASPDLLIIDNDAPVTVPIAELRPVADQTDATFAADSTALGPDGRIWFTQPFKHQVGQISTQGTVKTFYKFLDGAFPSRVVGGGDGNVWFGTQASNIGRVTPNGDISYFSLAPPGGAIRGIARGTDGKVWFTKFLPLGAISAVGYITESGATTEFPVPFSFFDAGAIAQGPDGNIWVVGSGVIGRVKPSGESLGFQVGGFQRSNGDPLPPSSITVGADGAMWFTDPGSHLIGRITLDGRLTKFLTPSPASVPMSITRASDGSLWFVEFAANKFARIAVDGTITEFGAPASETGLASLAVGADGNLWFSAARSERIGVFVHPSFTRKTVFRAMATERGFLESSGVASVAVSRAGSLNEPATVSFQTSDGTASLVY